MLNTSHQRRISIQHVIPTTSVHVNISKINNDVFILCTLPDDVVNASCIK